VKTDFSQFLQMVERGLSAPSPEDAAMAAAIALSRLMRIGGGASRELVAVLGQLGLSRPLIVTDSYLVKSSRVETLLVHVPHGLSNAASGGDGIFRPRSLAPLCRQRPRHGRGE
jgi:hypothetical protein